MPIAVLNTFIFSKYREVIILGITADVVYGSSGVYFNIPIVFTLSSVILYGIVTMIRSRVRYYA